MLTTYVIQNKRRPYGAAFVFCIINERAACAGSKKLPVRARESNSLLGIKIVQTVSVLVVNWDGFLLLWRGEIQITRTGVYKNENSCHKLRKFFAEIPVNRFGNRRIDSERIM